MYDIYNTSILLVDNDDIFLDKISQLLTSAGFDQIMKVNSCKDALMICQSSKKPFLVIMEYRFNIMSGQELVQQIKKYCKDIKVIVLSSSSKLADSFQSFEFGALSFIHKNDKDRDKTLIDTVKTWVDFYKSKEYTRTQFRKELKALTI